MFEQRYDVTGSAVDPRDVRTTPRSTLSERELPRLAAVLDARVDALDVADQLELGHQVTSCMATLEWIRCKVASGFAVRERQSDHVRAGVRHPQGLQFRPVGGVDTPFVPESAIPELALALGCSEHAATDLIAVGLDLRFRLPHTSNDFGGGRMTYAHARVISEATRDLSVDAVAALDARLAEAAQTRTPTRLRVLARRLVAKADPAAMQRRHQRQYDDRSTAIFPNGDGIAAFSFNHQLQTMCVIDDHLTAWARQRRIADPDTGLDAHKADAAAHLLLGQHPLTGAPLIDDRQLSPTPSTHDRDEAGHPVPTDGLPGPVWPAPGADFASQYDRWPRPTTVADPSGFLPARTELRVTMSADTLLGIDDDTCQLDGYGPITAAQARRLALESAPTVLRRVFTDPADGSILFLDAGRYRFTRDQTETVQTIHPISSFPGATTPARVCDIDHRRPYRVAKPGTGHDPPGQTVVTEGQPLGRRHHRIRTHAGWTPTLDPHDPHTVYWTSPHGRRYTAQDHDGA